VTRIERWAWWDGQGAWRETILAIGSGGGSSWSFSRDDSGEDVKLARRFLRWLLPVRYRCDICGRCFARGETRCPWA
jgi:hypothetical protein